MPRTARPNRPRVFLSFAGDNRPAAIVFGKELEARRLDTFIDSQSIPAGRDIVLSINDGLAQSDYYVLLWSRHAVDRTYVEAEWSAALSRELNDRRSFLFTVRLDDTELPLLLAPRKYLDFRGDWAAVADELVATWCQDNAVDVPVLPAPSPPAGNGGAGPAIALFIRNLDLSVAHVIRVPATVAEDELESLVCEALSLPTNVTTLDGAFETRFQYRLTHGDKPLSQLRDGSVIDLEVSVEWRDPKGPVAAGSYRALPLEKVTPAMRRAALASAFRHLRPR
jgi:hypothetical protein